MNDVSVSPLPTIDYGDRLRVGVLMPSGNAIAEPELKAMMPPGVSLLVSRLKLRGSSEPELMGMLDALDHAAELLADAAVDVIVFHCTAVSTFAPDLAARINERIARASGIRSFATSEAILAAVGHLRAERLTLLTPYIEAVHTREIGFLNANGIEVVGGDHLGIDSNTEMGKLQPDTLLGWARERIAPEADSTFISCTAIRSGQIIEPIERLTGRAVMTSNQCMAWRLLRSNGITDPVFGYGRLLRQ